MSPEMLLSKDLAAVGRASHARPIALEQTLQQVGAIAPAFAAARSLVHADQLAVIARTFAARSARVAAGAFALVAMTTFVILLCTIELTPDIQWGRTFLYRLFAREYSGFALPIAASTLFVYVAVRQIALHVGKKRLRDAPDPLARGRAMVGRLEQRAYAMSIAAPLVFVLVFGLLRVSIGENEMLISLLTPDGFVDYPPPWWPGFQTSVHATLGIMVLVGIVFASVCAWATWLPSRRIVTVAIAVFATTVLVGIRYDTGPAHHQLILGPAPVYALRTVLVLVGSMSLMVIAVALAARRHRRECDAIGASRSSGDRDR